MTVEAPAKRVDWRTPLHGIAEETYWIEVSEDGTETPRPAIRWHVSAEGLGRIMRMEACWNCLTGFPAPPRKDTWKTWKTSGYNWLHSVADSKKLVQDGCCPLCKAECSAAMLALQIDSDWTEEDARLKQAKMDNLAADREAEEHADRALADKLGLIDPVAPPSRSFTVKRRGES